MVTATTTLREMAVPALGHLLQNLSIEVDIFIAVCCDDSQMHFDT